MLSPRDQLIAEAKLAKELLQAPASDRPALYGQVYDQIYRMHLARNPDVLDFGASRSDLPFLLQRTRPGDVVAEVGCGTGLLAIELALAGRTVIGYDVSEVALEKASERARNVPNIKFESLSGFELPIGAATVEFAYSVGVLEHLHEEDVPSHIAAVARVLKPGGSYWIHTPHRSRASTAAKRFGVAEDAELDGDVHLKEWTYLELVRVLRQNNLPDVRLVWWFWQKRFRRVPVVPVWPVLQLERLPVSLPRNPMWASLSCVDACSILARRGAGGD